MLKPVRVTTLAIIILAAPTARADNAASGPTVTKTAQATPLSGIDVTVHSKATALSGVNVKPRPVCMGPRHPPDAAVPAPRLVGVFPAEGAVVQPGVLVLRFTFNVAMSCDGLFQSLPAQAKPCGETNQQHTVLSFDRTMIRMLCVVKPNTKYGLRMNPAPGRGIGRARFSSLAGLPLAPFELTFSTSSGPEVTDLETAQAEDKDGPAPAS